ncbi:MAG: protein kinase [Acidobacteria bacterium]|nr:protein kinase [Acidobacteriota bacterium]
MPATEQFLNNGRYHLSASNRTDEPFLISDAYDTTRDARVVIREVRSQRVVDASENERLRLTFVNSGTVLQGIRHESLIHVNDHFSESGRHYLVLESVDGDPLSLTLDAGGIGFEVNQVIDWADQMLAGLDYLHNFRPQVVHQRVRPQHLVLTSEGRIKLLAFTVAADSGLNITTNLQPNLYDGDIAYSPIEQIWDNLDSASQNVIVNHFGEKFEFDMGMPLDPRSDIYSAGATLYHIITGKKPVDALERTIELIEGNADPLRPITDFAPLAPPEIVEVISRAMQIARDQRFNSAAEMRNAWQNASKRADKRLQEEAMDEREAAELLSKLRGRPSLAVTAASLPETAGQDVAMPAATRLDRLRKIFEEDKGITTPAEVIAASHVELQNLEAFNSAPASELLEIPTAPAKPIAAVPDIELGSLIEEPRPQAFQAKDREHVPTAPPVAPAPAEPAFSVESEPAAVLEFADELIETDQSYMPSEETREADPNTFEEPFRFSMKDETADFAFAEPPPSRSMVPVIAGGGAFVLIAVAALWFLVFSGGEVPNSPAVAPTAVVTQPVQTQAEQQPDESAATEQVPAAVAETAPAEPETRAADSPEETRRKQQAAAKEREKPKTAEAPKPTPEKKKVTVDDLINDTE